MSLSGTALFTRIAMNPACEVQAAMGLDRSRNEKEFYQAVVGAPFEGEYGERNSARRRGAKFERNLLAPLGYARLLRDTVASVVGLTPDALVLRDLENEEPGTTQGNRVRRLHLTRAILQDTVTTASVTHVVVKPVLVLNTGFAPGDIRHRYVEPDFMVWVPNRSMFVPGDFKSFVVREGVAPADKLERVRLQLACDVIALRDEIRGMQPGLEARIASDGYLVFATPYGLSPDRPKLEDLAGAVEAVLKAIEAFRQHRERILGIAAGAPIVTAIPDLTSNYQEKCLPTCILADFCRSRSSDKSVLIGDGAAELLGPEISLSHTVALMTGASLPTSEAEVQLSVSLREIAGLPPLMRRIGGV